MKKLLWTSAMALTAAACMTACDDSSSGASNSIPEFKTEAALPDTCEMEVAKAGDTYFACFENKWIEVTDSATVEQLKEGLDEDEVKAKLEELEDLLKPATPAKPKSSSSKKTDEDVESSDSDEPESSASEEECTGRRCKTGSSSSKKSSGGSGSGEGGSGSGEGGSGEGGDSSPSSTDSSGDSSPSSTDSSGESSPSSAESSSPSSVSSSSLKRHVNFSPIDDYVTWSEDGTKATLNDDISLTTLESIFTKANKFENLNITSRSLLTTANKALDRWGSFLVPDVGYFLTEKTVYATSDSNVFVLMLTGMEKGDAVYTDIAPQGKCGTSVYAKRTKFCSNGTAYPLCDGKTYDPTKVFCDTRGTGTLYKHVTIGEQTWMAENLNYATAEGSFCYNDDPDNCTEYGRLYDWDVAVNTTSPVCPTGWKVPSASDFNTLLTYIKNDSGSDLTNYMLRSTTGWNKYDGSDVNGNNQYGFNLKPAGDRMNGKYENLGKTAYLVVTDGTYTYFLSTQGRSDANMYTWTTTTFARSVRCIKDTAGED